MSNPNPSASWQKGQSGNPKGRPEKGTSLTELMQIFLSQNAETTTEEKMMNKELFVRACFAHAVKGDPAFSNQIWKYVEGEPAQKIEAKIETTEAESTTAKEIAKLNEGFRQFMLSRGINKANRK